MPETRRISRAGATTMLLGVLILTGCATHAGGYVYVSDGPPPLVREVVVVSPGPNYVWLPGYHAWNGHAYVWVSGRWERPPRPHMHWANGAWRQNKHGWFWVEGHWR